MTACQHCQKSSQGKRRHATYCSPRCRVYASRKRNARPQAESVTPSASQDSAQESVTASDHTTTGQMGEGYGGVVIVPFSPLGRMHDKGAAMPGRLVRYARKNEPDPRLCWKMALAVPRVFPHLAPYWKPGYARFLQPILYLSWKRVHNEGQKSL
jgi:hypothetical protein